MPGQVKKQLQQTYNKLKKEIDLLVKNSNFRNLQKNVNQRIHKIQAELGRFSKKDISVNFGQLRKKVTNEKKQIEAIIDRIVKEEINKAKKFVKNQKIELNRLQSKLEAYGNKKSVSKKKSTKKKVATKKKSIGKNVSRKKTTSKKKATRKKVAKK